MQIPDTISQAILETPRLLLKELSPEIIYNLFDTGTDDELKAYLALTDDELIAEKYKVANGLTTHQTSIKNFLLWEKADDRPIGNCGFHNWYARHARAELGYLINLDADKGKGYMKEAVRAVVTYGFEHMQLNRVEAMVGPNNEPSLKLVKGMGFKEEGYLREHYRHPQEMQDSVIFSLLKREYLLVKDQWV